MNIAVAGLFFQELLLTSDESSEEDEYHRGSLILKPKIRNFVEEVVDCYSDGEFREHFRMYGSTFNHVLTVLKNKISGENITDRHPLSAKEHLLLTLTYFSTPESYRSIARSFNVGKATGLRAVRKVTMAILEMTQTYINWPNEENVQMVRTAFNDMGFPNTIGIIDGCYIPISQPKQNGISYITRKKFPALILQAVCDHKMLFTHCYVGEVGSTHDATVLRRSEVFEYLTTSREEKFPNDSHLLGDKAYPCLQTLMVPFKDNGHLTEGQRRFNYNLSKSRCTIERAFALLKKRFRRLKFFEMKSVEWTCKYIMACCVLHNICIYQNDIININNVEIDIEDENVPINEELYLALHRIGARKRQYIMNTMI